MAIAVVTLTNAIAKTDTQITLSSTTSMTAGPSNQTTLSIDNEQLLVTAVVSSTVVNVERAQGQTKPAAHGAGCTVFWGPASNFTQVGGYYNTQPANTNQINTVLFDTCNPKTVTTAGAVTYTAGDLLRGLILRDPNGAGRADVTPTAALMVAAVPGANIYQSFEFTIRNDADAAETITMTAGTGFTTSGTMTIAQNNMKRFKVVFTNVQPGTEACTIYSLGTVVS